MSGPDRLDWVAAEATVPEQVVPYVRAVGGDGLVYYCGMSRFNKVIDTVIETTGVGAYYVSPLDDLAEAKRLVAGRGLTCGVINDARMIDWTPAEVAREVKRLLLGD